MDLRSYETRRLIDKGLANIKNPFMIASVKKNEFVMKGVVNVHGVSWYIAPGVNAVTRVGTLSEKKALFESMLDFKAYTMIPSTKRGCSGEQEMIVEQAVRVCTNARNNQNKVRDTALPKIEKLIEKYNLLDNKLLIICLDFEADKALTGLMANKIMSQYNKPTLILNKIETGDEDMPILWSGSGRNCHCLNFPNFKSFLADSGFVEFAEGHEGAFGVGIRPENILALNAYANDQLANVEFINVYEPDIIFTPQDLYGGYKLYKQVKDLRMKRRQAKDENDLLRDMYEYIKSQPGQTFKSKIQSIQGSSAKVYEAQSRRTYNPRQRSDLTITNKTCEVNRPFEDLMREFKKEKVTMQGGKLRK
jgi:single-stranded-DNA-specific exonuclease